jgi:hypothetical protein
MELLQRRYPRRLALDHRRSIAKVAATLSIADELLNAFEELEAPLRWGFS